jgi:hypothetical protein
VTNESRIVLCKPLNATEIEVLQHLADGLGTAEIAANRSSTAQLIKELHVPSLLFSRRRGFEKTEMSLAMKPVMALG